MLELFFGLVLVAAVGALYGGLKGAKIAVGLALVMAVSFVWWAANQ